MLVTKQRYVILWWHHQSFLLKQRFTLSYYFGILELSIWKINFIFMDTGGQVTLWSKEVKWSEVTQSCPTFRVPMACSLPGSSVLGTFQARVLEWVAISFSRGSSRPRDQTQVSHIVGRQFTVWATREVK